MRMAKTVFCLTLLGSLLLCSICSAAQYLENGGFETGDISSWTQSWAIGFSTFGANNAKPKDGTYSLQYVMNHSESEKGFRLSQIEYDSLSGARFCNISADWYLTELSGTSSTKIQVLCYDSSLGDPKIFATYYWGNVNWDYAHGLRPEDSSSGGYYTLNIKVGDSVEQWNHLSRDVARDVDATFGFGTWASLHIQTALIYVSAWAYNQDTDYISGFIDNIALRNDADTEFTYQGKLTNPTTGQPVADGSYQVQFKVYDALTEGNLLWSSATQTITTKNGLFTTVVSGVSTALFAGDRWLEVTVQSEVLAPRVKFTPVPTAIQALTL